MAKYYEAFNARLESYLQEKNRMTELLDKLEKTTGVKKLYITQGCHTSLITIILCFICM